MVIYQIYDRRSKIRSVLMGSVIYGYSWSLSKMCRNAANSRFLPRSTFPSELMVFSIFGDAFYLFPTCVCDFLKTAKLILSRQTRKRCAKIAREERAVSSSNISYLIWSLLSLKVDVFANKFK